MAPSYPPVSVFPSLLQRVRDHIAGDPRITALSVARVAPNLNGYESDMRYIMVSPAPGSRPVTRRLDARTITVNCYAEDYESTLLLAETALAVVLSMRGKYTDLVVTDTETSVTPYDLTDQLNGEYRFVFDVVIYFHPA